MSDSIQAVRAFSRAYTATLQLLDEGLLETPYTLTESRVIFELGLRDRSDTLELRRTLGIDAGYLSRILAQFETDGLVVRSRSSADARRQEVQLTERGRGVRADLDARSTQQVSRLLAGLAQEEQRRLVAGMDTVREVLATGTSTPGTVLLREPRPGDYGWMVERHGALYAAEYGWEVTFEALVARIVADFAGAHDSAHERAWIAELDGRRVGCVLCVRQDDETAKLRILLVEPSARGHGIGGQLVDACVDFARRTGYRRVVLWTNDVLVAARHRYEKAGFQLDHEGPHHSFGHDLVEQTWSLEL